MNRKLLSNYLNSNTNIQLFKLRIFLRHKHNTNIKPNNYL